MSGSSAPGYLHGNIQRNNIYDGIRPGFRPVLSLKEMEKVYPNEYAFWLMLKEVQRSENGTVTRLQIQTMTQGMILAAADNNSTSNSYDKTAPSCFFTISERFCHNFIPFLHH